MKSAAVAIVAIATSTAMASVSGFVETFSGNGSYTSDPAWGTYEGLDNPNWRIGTDLGEVTLNGLVVTTEADQFDPDDVATSRIVRELDGVGSFIETILISMFDSAVPFESHSSAFFWFEHYAVPFPGFSDLLSTWISTPFEPGARYAAVGRQSDFETLWTESADVGNASTFALSLSYDYFHQTVSFEYLDLETDEIGFSSGPLEWSVPFDERHYSSLFVRTGGAAHMNFVVSEWRLEPIAPDGTVADFNDNGALDVDDIDLLNVTLKAGEFTTRFDLNTDQILNEEDRAYWIHELANTYFGDSNLDGEFNSADLVNVFVAAEYEDAIEGNSTWATGDWSGNGEFDSADLILAFQDGGYELGPREAVRSVPEPNESGVAVLFGFVIVWLVRRRRLWRSAH